ncbi:MAG TPA: SGNH/GDSL hydrolase family protein [Phycisphaerae bacterium]|nr:SGNH/GDSL hydrolase family protein [Phycisphaerae bacterium]
MVDLGKLMAAWRQEPAVGRRVVAFGASNTSVLWHSLGRHGWPCWLMVALRGYVGHHVSLTNAGVSGDATDDMLARIGRDVFPHNPSLVIVTAGGNDVKKFTVAEYTDRLAEIVRRVTGAGAVPVLQTYYAMDVANADAAYERFGKYMAACAATGSRCDVPCIDQHSLFQPWYAAEPEEYRRILLDPLHLLPVGNAVMGTLCVRHFGLPDPQLPDDLAQSVPAVLERMARYAQLPVRRP